MVNGLNLDHSDVVYFSQAECLGYEDAVFSIPYSFLPTNFTFTMDDLYNDLYGCIYSSVYDLHVSIFPTMDAWRPNIVTRPIVHFVHEHDGRIVYNVPTEFSVAGPHVRDGDLAKIIPEWGNCMEVRGVGPIGVVHENKFTLIFNEMSDSLRSGVRLCYQYGEEYWMSYEDVILAI